MAFFFLPHFHYDQMNKYYPHPKCLLNNKLCSQEDRNQDESESEGRSVVSDSL